MICNKFYWQRFIKKKKSFIDKEGKPHVHRVCAQSTPKELHSKREYKIYNWMHIARTIIQDHSNNDLRNKFQLNNQDLHSFECTIVPLPPNYPYKAAIFQVKDLPCLTNQFFHPKSKPTNSFRHYPIKPWKMKMQNTTTYGQLCNALAIDTQFHHWCCTYNTNPPKVLVLLL